MARTRQLTIAAATLFAVAIAGCGFGEGESNPGTATLTVTRDYGGELLLEASEEDPAATTTVVRLLDREAEIETSYGGNFVDSIDGIESNASDGRREDWFFYVNGYWSPIGAGEAKVEAGDRVWWDYRDWTDAYRVSAVVGSWPEPFLSGDPTNEGSGPPPTELVCLDVQEACDIAADRLRDAGAELRELDAAGRRGEPDEVISVLVGSWEAVRSDPVAARLERGPDISGVYGRVRRCDGAWALEPLDERAEPVAPPADAGWVAALGDGEREPTWIVSGTGTEGAVAAAESLDPESLGDRYAIAVTEAGAQAIPADDLYSAESGGTERSCR